MDQAHKHVLPEGITWIDGLTSAREINDKF